MKETILKVNGMSCAHCAKSITKTVSALPGMDGVTVNLNTGTVTIKHDPSQCALDQIREKIEAQGFDVI